MDVLIVIKRCPKVINLEIELYYESLKVVEFMMELHYESPKEGEASVEASPHGLPHLFELVNGMFHKKD